MSGGGLDSISNELHVQEGGTVPIVFNTTSTLEFLTAEVGLPFVKLEGILTDSPSCANLCKVSILIWDLIFTLVWGSYCIS